MAYTIKKQTIPYLRHIYLIMAGQKVMSKKKDKIQREIGSFIRQYQRKAQPGWDPNDRRYDRKMENKIKKLDPAELSEIISGCDTDITSEIDELWFNFKPIPGVKFFLNDSIEIIKGENIGEKGFVISLIEIHPEPRYLVELTNGKDEIVLESQLRGY